MSYLLGLLTIVIFGGFACGVLGIAEKD